MKRWGAAIRAISASDSPRTVREHERTLDEIHAYLLLLVHRISNPKRTQSDIDLTEFMRMALDEVHPEKRYNNRDAIILELMAISLDMRQISQVESFRADSAKYTTFRYRLVDASIMSQHIINILKGRKE